MPLPLSRELPTSCRAPIDPGTLESADMQATCTAATCCNHISSYIPFPGLGQQRVFDAGAQSLCSAHQVEQLLRVPRLRVDRVVEAAQLPRVLQAVADADRRALAYRLPDLSCSCEEVTSLNPALAVVL